MTIPPEGCQNSPPVLLQPLDFLFPQEGKILLPLLILQLLTVLVIDFPVLGPDLNGCKCLLTKRRVLIVLDLLMSKLLIASNTFSGGD